MASARSVPARFRRHDRGASSRMRPSRPVGEAMTRHRAWWAHRIRHEQSSDTAGGGRGSRCCAFHRHARRRPQSITVFVGLRPAKTPRTNSGQRHTSPGKGRFLISHHHDIRRHARDSECACAIDTSHLLQGSSPRITFVLPTRDVRPHALAHRSELLTSSER